MVWTFGLTFFEWVFGSLFDPTSHVVKQLTGDWVSVFLSLFLPPFPVLVWELGIRVASGLLRIGVTTELRSRPSLDLEDSPIFRRL